MKNIFYKYNCSGNTFIVVKYVPNLDYKVFSKKICSKSDGVSADGLLVVKDDINEVFYYNQDGSQAIFCGNGLRATLHYLKDQKGLYKRTVPILFNNEVYYGKVLSEEPFCSEIKIRKEQIKRNIRTKTNNSINFINYKNYVLRIFPVKVGVFHIVIINDTNYKNNEFLDENDLNEIKTILLNYYEEEPNIDIIKLNVDSKTLDEVTFYERGVGYTTTCGSGSIAIAAILELMNYTMEQYIKISDDLFVVIQENTINLIGKSKLVTMGKYLC